VSGRDLVEEFHFSNLNPQIVLELLVFWRDPNYELFVYFFLPGLLEYFFLIMFLLFYASFLNSFFLFFQHNFPVQVSYHMH